MIRERLNADILAPITDVELDVRLTHLPLSRGGGGVGGLGCGFGFSAIVGLLSLYPAIKKIGWHHSTSHPIE